MDAMWSAHTFIRFKCIWLGFSPNVKSSVLFSLFVTYVEPFRFVTSSANYLPRLHSQHHDFFVQCSPSQHVIDSAYYFVSAARLRSKLPSAKKRRNIMESIKKDKLRGIRIEPSKCNNILCTCSSQFDSMFLLVAPLSSFFSD